MNETLFAELKRYVGWSVADEAALRALHRLVAPEFSRISIVFYDRILQHEAARKALTEGESMVGRLRHELHAWLDKLLTGPWDEDYYELRARIGRKHVSISLPQHYMLTAMNVLRQELTAVVDRGYLGSRAELHDARLAIGKVLDLELAIMLHTYREDLLAAQARTERLATFGQLVGSIGHELRNPLGVMESSLYILRGRAPDDARVTKHIDRIGEQVGIANVIISDLLDMIRDKPLTTETIEVREVLTAAAGQLGMTPGLEPLVALPPIQGDKSKLRQVFVNLLDNAREAAGPGGDVFIDGAVEGGLVAVGIEDTGPGVDDATRRRLFEPLVTTKAKGIGLGLALVKRIVEQHGGSVAYQPRARGARFVVRLPKALP